MNKKKLKNKIGRWRKKTILLTHYSKYLSLKPSNKQKQIIVCFDGAVEHGGFVDRLKGILSFYQISKKLNYNFFILFNHPFSLESLLEVNEIDWELRGNRPNWNPFKSKILYLNNNFDVNPLKVIEQSAARTFYVYANIDYSRTIHPSLTNSELEERWRNDFNILFKKSELLQKELNAVSVDSYIAFHSRFTSLMGDFKDTTSHSLSLPEKKMLQASLLKKIKEKLASQTKQSYIFSDSLNFINYVTSNSDVKAIEGIPLHMDNFEGNNKLEGHLKTLVDFFMLSNSDVIYFLKAKKMYNSNFAKYAAIIGNTKFERIDI